MTEEMFFGSIIRNGPSGMEIIIVDDASPDDFRQQADEMIQRVMPKLEAQGHHVVFIKSRVNLGYTHSYNVGLRRTTGNVIFVSNSDVMISKGAMQEMVKLIMKDSSVMQKIQS